MMLHQSTSQGQLIIHDSAKPYVDQIYCKYFHSKKSKTNLCVPFPNNAIFSTKIFENCKVFILKIELIRLAIFSINLDQKGQAFLISKKMIT